MNLTAYELSAISGGFAIVGALIGAISAYRFGIHLAVQQQRRIAAANFRAAFSYTISQMTLITKGGSAKNDLLLSTFPDLAVAIETYRPYVASKDQAAYEQAWQQYHSFSKKMSFADYYIKTDQEQHPEDLFKRRVDAILNFAHL